MKKNHSTFYIFLVLFIVSACNKEEVIQNPSVTKTILDNTFWIGAYGEKKGDAFNYNHPITILLAEDEITTLYTQTYDTVNSNVLKGSYKVSGENVNITCTELKTNVKFTFTGKIIDEKIEGVWSGNGVSKGVFFINRQKLNENN